MKSHYSFKMSNSVNRELFKLIVWMNNDSFSKVIWTDCKTANHPKFEILLILFTYKSILIFIIK